MKSRKLELFLRFARVGVFTFGGGYAMIPLIEREVVDRCNWMERKEFYDALLVTQSAPGALAVNIALVVGMRLEGAAGAALSALGVLLPSYAVILAIAASFASFHSVPVVESVFRGVRPAVVALIAVAGVRMGRERPELFTFLLAGAGLAALLLLRVSPFLLVLPFIGAGIARAFLRRRRGVGQLADEPRSSE